MERIMIPIFIGGADRSGTTLLGSLLSCIPESCVTPESGFKLQVPWKKFTSSEEYKKALSANWKFTMWGITPDQLDQLSLTSEAEFFQGLVTAYHGRKPKYWVDHTPCNLQDIRRLTDIFPEAKFIHIIRDGRAVANSIMPLEWGPNTPITAAKEWIQKVAYGLAAETLFPDRVMKVYYEEVVADPVLQVGNILQFLGVDYCLSSTEDFNLSNNIVPNYSKKQHAFVGQLPQKEFANKWQWELSITQIRDFEYFGRIMLEMLGYKLYASDQPKPSKLHIVNDITEELIRKKIINSRRYRKRKALSS